MVKVIPEYWTDSTASGMYTFKVRIRNQQHTQEYIYF